MHMFDKWPAKRHWDLVIMPEVLTDDYREARAVYWRRYSMNDRYSRVLLHQTVARLARDDHNLND